MDFLELSVMLRSSFRIMEAKYPLRYRRVIVDTQQLSLMVQGKIKSDLPDDAELYGVAISEDHDGLSLIFRSETWDSFGEGEMIPMFHITWTLKESVPV